MVVIPIQTTTLSMPCQQLHICKIIIHDPDLEFAFTRVKSDVGKAHGSTGRGTVMAIWRKACVKKQREDMGEMIQSVK